MILTFESGKHKPMKPESFQRTNDCAAAENLPPVRVKKHTEVRNLSRERNAVFPTNTDRE